MGRSRAIPKGLDDYFEILKMKRKQIGQVSRYGWDGEKVEDCLEDNIPGRTLCMKRTECCVAH